MKTITIDDKEYPEKLRKIKNPPKKLYTEGNIELLSKNTIAIVGSRDCSKDGKKLARKFAIELTKQGLVIVSGMAVGIDEAAHKGVLEVKGETIAVLGNGFNYIFPQENTNLYKEIIENGGLIVSEYPPDAQASSNKFLERNRIVSGLSLGVLVIEAEARSGTSVTAKLAKEQERKVFVLPHEISNKKGVGTNNLIKKGATLITSTKEIIKAYNFLQYDESIKELNIEYKGDIEDEIKKLKDKGKKLEEKLKKYEKEKIEIFKKYEKEKKKVEALKKIKQKQLKKSNEDEKTKECKEVEFKNQDYKEVYELIKDGIYRNDEISRITKKTINEVANVLFMLELEGYITKEVGGYKCT